MNKNVLVIDDDKNFLDSYREIFSPSADMEAGLEAVFSDLEDDNSDHPDFSVQYAEQGETGYHQAKTSLEKNDPIAVAFIDMRMPPGWDGLETAKALRKLDDRIYIVIVTAYADKSIDELQDALRQNILLLRKPFLTEEIYQLARNLCNAWDRDEELKNYNKNLEKMLTQKTAELKETYKLSENIVTSMTDALFVSDDKAIIKTVNPAASTLLGYTEAELNGMPVGKLFEEEEEEEEEEVFRNQERIMVRKDGSHVPVLMSRAVMRETPSANLGIGHSASGKAPNTQNQMPNTVHEGKRSEQITGVVLVAKDISDIKKVEEERKQHEVQLLSQSKLATLGEMATGVAHEINQPLTFIKSENQLMLRDIKDGDFDSEEAKDVLVNIDNQVGKITSIINHMRSFGRSEISDQSDINLPKVLEGTLLLMNERLRLQNIQFEKTITGIIPIIKGNPNQIEQVFINFLQNSMDALAKNNGTKTINVEIKQKETNIIQTIFSDNGEGIPADVREKIFEPFYTTKEVGKGTGLGLSISYGIIESHGGRIYCESNPGEGTKMIIEFVS